MWCRSNSQRLALLALSLLLLIRLAFAQAPGAATGVTVIAKPATPTITLLNPSSGVVGASVTITGSGFNATQGTGTVTFNGVTATVTSWSPTSLITTVPSGTTTGSVVVTQNGVASLGSSFTITGGGIIDPTRRISWAPGVPGGIPARPTVCATVSADTTGVSDASAAINAAITGCAVGQTVLIPAGTYRLNNQIQISKGITLRGASASTVTLNCYAAWHCIQMGDFPGNPVATNVSGSPAKDATTLTVASITSPSLSVGDYIAIDQLDDGVEVLNADGTGGTGIQICAGEKRGTTRCLGQVTKVTAINGLTLTISPALYHAYSASQVPQVWELNQGSAMTVLAGIEDFKLERISPTGSEGYQNVKLVACASCWVKGIESKMTETWHVDLDRCFQCEVRDSYFNDAWTFTGGQGYGVVLSYTFATLVENNILYHTRHALTVRDASAGNVFGYNYSVNSDQGDGWLAADLNSHGHHPTMNLWEGNIAAKVYGDFTWGSSSYNTFYRNWIIRDSQPTNPTNSRRAVDVEYHNWYYNLVGNVLGQSGQTWDAFDPGTSRTPTTGRYVYTFGYFSDGLSTSTDPQALATVYRHGNFDYQSNSTIWDTGTSNHTLPSSLYLAAKPAWFGTCAYPAIGSDLTPVVLTLPAKARYTEGSYFATPVACGGGGGSSFYYTGTLRPATCSAANINTQIAAAVSLDIVRVAAGCTGQTLSVSIPSTKGILLDLNGGTYGGTIGITPNATFKTRVTGAGLAGTSTATLTRAGVNGTGTLQVFGFSLTTARWRADHLAFTGAGHAVLVFEASPGLADHLTMTGATSIDEAVHLMGWYAGTTTGWTTPMPSAGATRAAGSEEAIMIEDSTFTGAQGLQNPPWFEAFYGTRVMYRYNNFNYFQTDAHGNNQDVGTRWWELIKNNFGTGPTNNQQIANQRAGSGIIYGNTESGSFTPGPDIQLCQELTSGVSSSYPSQDQIGRGTGTWPSQALDPAYIWSNAQPVQVNTCGGVNFSPTLVQFNRDVYRDTGASCTAGGACTTGVGSGTTLPTTCTTNVGFWKTDAGGNWDTTHGGANDGALYKCTSTNTWTLYYTPYTYPNPLQTGLEPDK